jgi:hypothetical protein
MATTEERMKVLKMVEAGKMTPEDAAKLLSALTESSRSKQNDAKSGASSTRSSSYSYTTADSARAGQRARNVRVRITDSGKKGGPNVNIAVPVGLVSVLSRILNRFGINPAKSEGSDAIDVHELLAFIEAGHVGRVIEINGDDGELVEVTLE